MDVKATVDVGQNTKDLLEQGGGAVTRIIEELAKSLGMTIDKIFPYYVKQAVIEGYVGLIAWAGFQIVSLIIAGVALKLYFVFDEKSRDDARVGAATTCVISLIIFAIALIIGAVHISTWVSMIKNPEYAAIHQLINDAGKLLGKK